MTENEEINDCIEERISVPIIVLASSLSFESLCKLNEDKSQKDLQPSDFALLCVTIALLCVTFHSAENRDARIHCYKCGDSEPQEPAPAHDKDVRQYRNNKPRPSGPVRSAVNYPADSIFHPSYPDCSRCHFPQYHRDVHMNIARYVFRCMK